MWRKFTVYGLRFSKTSFWNRINTGFLDPAVATVLTACGIETTLSHTSADIVQCVVVATVLTACGIETRCRKSGGEESFGLQQCLPLAVLKLDCCIVCFVVLFVATVLTACGIETQTRCIKAARELLQSCNSAYRLRY